MFTFSALELQKLSGWNIGLLIVGVILFVAGVCVAIALAVLLILRIIAGCKWHTLPLYSVRKACTNTFYCYIVTCVKCWGKNGLCSTVSNSGCLSLSVSLQGRLMCGTGYWWEPQQSSLW